jgi:hypothetical protein
LVLEPLIVSLYSEQNHPFHQTQGMQEPSADMTYLSHRIEPQRHLSYQHCYEMELLNATFVEHGITCTPLRPLTEAPPRLTPSWR